MDPKRHPGILDREDLQRLTAERLEQAVGVGLRRSELQRLTIARLERAVRPEQAAWYGSIGLDLSRDEIEAAGPDDPQP